MLASVLRVVAVVVAGLLVLDFLGWLPGSWAVVAGFVGLLMGWSLQAPVSGLAAWVLVNVKRPFRIGDRVMLPSMGLTGDVSQIGMMSTRPESGGRDGRQVRGGGRP